MSIKKENINKFKIWDLKWGQPKGKNDFTAFSLLILFVTFSICLDRTYIAFAFCVAFCSFFFSHAFQRQNLAETATVHVLCINSSQNFWLFSTSVGPVHCSRDPQTSLFSNFFIKNRSHGTIHTFKNYFAIVFSVLVK